MRNLLGILIFIWSMTLEASLLDHLQRASLGDYIVTAQGKNLTLLHIYSKKDQILTIEEITVPANCRKIGTGGWKGWVSQNAPGHTAWILYSLNLQTGQLLSSYSVMRQAKQDISSANNFLTTLLNLQLEPIPPRKRKKLGASFQIWQPKMVVEGKTIPGVQFDAWSTHWPKDQTELSERSIDVYVPHESDKYPSYFPYWLEISGLVGSAKVRIIDSGKGMESPAKIKPEVKGNHGSI